MDDVQSKNITIEIGGENMPIVTKEDFIRRMSERFGEDTSDETLALIEDFSDTYDSLNVTDSEDWKTKYEENDKAWREKYRNRFMNTDEQKEFEDEIKKEDKKDMSFESLFEEK